MPFSYTMGLADKSLPEIIVFGLSPEVAQQLINIAVPRLLNSNLPLGEAVAEIAKCNLFFQKVDPENVSDYIIQANNRSGIDLPAIQMVWPDEKNVFPWDSDFNTKLEGAQVLLFEPAGLKCRLH